MINCDRKGTTVCGSLADLMAEYTNIAKSLHELIRGEFADLGTTKQVNEFSRHLLHHSVDIALMSEEEFDKFGANIEAFAEKLLNEAGIAHG